MHGPTLPMIVTTGPSGGNVAGGGVVTGASVVAGGRVVTGGCVTGGPASFVIPAKGFTDFARAMRRKLVLEISGLTPEEMPEGNPMIIKVAAANEPQRAAPVRPSRPPTNQYSSACNFPMFGGFGGFGNFSFR